MATLTEAPVTEPELRVAGDVTASAPERRSFLLVAGGVTAAVTLLIVGLSLRMNDGHLVYALDDAAIHMSVAHQLADHGTWGVTNGVYESASSSPAWTLLLAAPTAVVPQVLTWLPLVLNALAAAWILWLFGGYQTFLQPRRGRPLTYLAVATIPLAVLFLPALVMVGMEHLLHAALVLLAVILFVRLEASDLHLRAATPFLAVMLLAGAVRVETVFVAAGCAVALLLRCLPNAGTELTRPRWRWPAALRLGVVTVAVSAIPFVIYGLVNRAFDRGFLPNSIAAKAAIGQRGALRDLGEISDAIRHDGVLPILAVLGLAYLLFAIAGSANANLLAVTVFLVALVLHATYGDMGFFERYQAYLVILGVFVACRVAGEVVPEGRATPALAVLLVAGLALSTLRIDLLFQTPLATSNTYRQRYQLGRFFEREYQGKAVATGELGYVSLFHEGPLVDLLGLGSHQVVEELERHGGKLPADVAQRLVEEQHVEAIGVYPLTLFATVSRPRSWLLQGRWILDQPKVSTIGASLEFYASNRALRTRLDRRLERFAPLLPDHIVYRSHDALMREFLRGTEGAGK